MEYESHDLDVSNPARRTYCAMVTAMDEAIGNISSALKATGQDKNTLIIFTTDNGGQTLNGGNNFPLRGNKATLWEGGTRGAAFIHGSMLAARGEVSSALVHVTDWLPTLISAGGGRPGTQSCPRPPTSPPCRPADWTGRSGPVGHLRQARPGEQEERDALQH